MDPILVPVPVACDALGIKRTKLYELISLHRLSVVKIGRRTLVRADSIRALAAEGSPDAA